MMTLREREREYETRYESSGIVSAPSADSDLLTVSSDKQSQLSNLSITAGEDNSFRVELRDQDGSNPQVVASYSSVQEVSEGTFENPVCEAGAAKEYAVVVSSAGSADINYSANLRVDEHTGR